MGAQGGRKHRATSKGVKVPKPEGAPLNLREAASYLGLNDQTVRSYVRKDQLTHLRIGTRGDLRFRREDLDRLLVEQTASWKKPPVHAAGVAKSPHKRRQGAGQGKKSSKRKVGR